MGAGAIRSPLSMAPRNRRRWDVAKTVRTATDKEKFRNDIGLSATATMSPEAIPQRTGGVGGSTGAANNRLLRSSGTSGGTLQTSPVSATDDGDLSGVRALTATGAVTAPEFKVGSTAVVGAQGAAVANATGSGDVVAQLNTLLARLRAHGLIAS